MSKRTSLLGLLLILGLLLTACSPATPAAVAPTAAPPSAATNTPAAAATNTPIPAATDTPAPAATTAVAPTAAPPAAGVDTAAYNNLPDLKGRTIKAVTANDYTPLNFIDAKTGKAVGWEYDAVNEICRRLNCTVDWQVTSWDTMIAAVKTGQFDVGMDGITITDERAKEVDFSAPYMRSEQYMLVRADETRFSTPEQFKADPKLLIGSQAGTTNFYAAVYSVLDGDEKNPRIIIFETFGASVQALIKGDVDMVLMDKASSAGYIGANPDKLKLVGQPLAGEDFGFIFTPKSDLRAPFDQAIAALKADGFFDYLSRRWFFLADPAGNDVYHQLPDLKGRAIKAVTANDFTPLNFIDARTGKAVGWEYEAVNEICRRLNCTVDWQVTSWDTMIAAVKTGQFDVGMDGITITNERAKEVDFSVPYLRSEQYMLVRADETRFSTPEQFKADPKLLIGSQAGTTNFYAAVYSVLDGDEKNPRIIIFETFGASVQALIKGDVDMVLMDKASSAGYIGANPDKLKLVGQPLAGEDFGFIFTPKSDLRAPFDQAIGSMAKDGFLDHLSNRWFFLFNVSAK